MLWDVPVCALWVPSGRPGRSETGRLLMLAILPLGCWYVGSQGLFHSQQARKRRNQTNGVKKITFICKANENLLRIR